MNPNLVPASAPEVFSTSLPAQPSGNETTTDADFVAGAIFRLESTGLASGTRFSCNSHPWRSAYVAFFATVFACMAAAAAVASNDVPLLLGGF